MSIPKVEEGKQQMDGVPRPMADEFCSETGRWTDTALDPFLPEVLPRWNKWYCGICS